MPNLSLLAAAILFVVVAVPLQVAAARPVPVGREPVARVSTRVAGVTLLGYAGIIAFSVIAVSS